jgi:predicted small lipoprotein YifL
MAIWMKWLILSLTLMFSLAACSPQGAQTLVPDNDRTPEVKSVGEPQSSTSPGIQYDDLDIITLLPHDGIPAIDDPQFITLNEADIEYTPGELVIGVNFDGDARAYSIPLLSRHEIVNDTVGGRKIAVTW